MSPLQCSRTSIGSVVPLLLIPALNRRAAVFLYRVVSGAATEEKHGKQ